MRYVFCLRNPLDVAKSLQSRDGLSLARSIYLWFSYLRLPLIHTAGEQRLWICYEDLLSDCLRELVRIAHFLERPHLAERLEIRQALHDFLDTGLQHHRSETRSSIGNGSATAAARALHLSWQVYLALQQQPSPADGELLQQIDEGLSILHPDILKERHAEEAKWRQQLQTVADHLSAVIPKGEKYIFVDEEQLGVSAPDRHPLPFLEKDGEYWGTPPDDDTAIRELERLRRLGARSLVVAWPAFWWLEYYSGWHHYLRAHFRCVLQNDRLIVFALR
jgi:hypothetical protein